MYAKTTLFPSVDFFSTLKTFDILVIDACENYQKRSYRNKYKILTANGPLTLSIPLQKGKNEKQLIKDVKISYEIDWVRNHLETIKSAYGKSAYFDYYFDPMELLLQKNLTYLFDLNGELLVQILEWLNFEIEISRSQEFLSATTDFLNEAKTYPQVFESKFGFTPNLSIIDLMFNMGPESRLYL